jgi:pimeloyl-ACP methyl ester carboxylesterase
MKQHCSRVSVVGFRLGATLASLALNEEDIENLILWAPVVNGRGYVREMTVIDMMSEARPDGTEVPGTVEAAGFRMSGETIADLSKLSLLQSRPLCQKILIARRDDAPPDQRLVDHFRGLGIMVEARALPGVAQMLLEPHKAQLPVDAIHEMTDWLHCQVAIEPTLPPIDALLVQNSIELSAYDTTIRETPWRISRSPDLFGIICEPANASNDLPTIVLLNAGAAYHIGPGRMNVEMSRQFAADGYRCVRLDLSGLGDSVPEDVSAENDSYPSTMFRDIQIALEAVRGRCGCQRIVLMGLCSGAYASFQAAVQFADSTLVESVLINPLTYFWRDGMSLETAPTEQLIREHYYLTSALQPGKWLKLLSGRSQIGIRGAVRMVARRLLGKKRRKVHSARELPCQCPSHPQVDDLTDDLQRLAGSRRQVSMFFSTTDPGYSILTSKAGRQARQMLQSGQLQTHFTDNADHTFSRYTARRRLIQAICDHLNRRYRATN